MDQEYQLVPTLPQPRGLAPRVETTRLDAELLCLVGLALALGVLVVIGAGVLAAWAWRAVASVVGGML